MIYKHPITIPFQDIDAAGVVFFVHLFRYAHESYEAFMGDIRQPLDRLLAEGKNHLPIVHAEADYHRPLHYGEQVVLELSVVALANSSFCLAYRCMSSDGICYAEIKTVHVALDAQTKKKIIIPASLRAELEPYCSISVSD